MNVVLWIAIGMWLENITHLFKKVEKKIKENQSEE